MAVTKKQGKSIQPDQIWRILRRRWVWGALTFGTVLTTTTVLTCGQHQSIYRAQVQLALPLSASAVVPRGVGEHPNGYHQNHVQPTPNETMPNESGLIQAQVQTQVAMVRSIPIVQEVIQSLDLKDVQGQPLTTDAFLNQLTVDAPGNTHQLAVSYHSHDPQQSLAVVNRFVTVYMRQQQTHRLPSGGVQEQVVQERPSAQLVSQQVSPKILLNLILGSLLGSFLAIAVMLILDAQDHSIKTAAEAQTVFGSSVLAVIPNFDATLKRVLEHRDDAVPPTTPAAALILKTAPQSAASQAYRGLQTRLNFRSADRPARKIVITSSIPQEGKSTTIANLALTIAELGPRVLLIDADLRLPSQHDIWGVSNRSGLSNVIAVGLHPQQVIRQVSQNLDLLTAGLLMPNPMVLLDSRRMATLLEHFGNTYDYILIDAPPVTVAADALVIGKMVDGILTVVRPGLVETPMAEAARDLLNNSGQTLLGAVVNGIPMEAPPVLRLYSRLRHRYQEAMVR